VLSREPPAPAGTLVANPPYGVRLEDLDRLAAFYPKLGDALKRRFAGWHAWLFTGDLRLAKFVGLKVERRIPLWNGAIECRLFGIPLVAGSHRDAREARKRE
jgi:putative N6-adenine-specific DNA methylase